MIGRMIEFEKIFIWGTQICGRCGSGCRDESAAAGVAAAIRPRLHAPGEMKLKGCTLRVRAGAAARPRLACARNEPKARGRRASRNEHCGCVARSSPTPAVRDPRALWRNYFKQVSLQPSLPCRDKKKRKMSLTQLLLINAQNESYYLSTRNLCCVVSFGRVENPVLRLRKP